MTVLKRRLDRVDALAISLGAVIGVGVFRNTGVVLRGAGGFAEATLLWLTVGTVCLAGAILYADLSARAPEAGGGYAYVRIAFGGPAAFIYGWMNAAVAIPVRQAAVYAAVGERLSAWLPGDKRWLGAGALLALTGLTLIGVRTGAIAQRIFTSGKLATIALVIGLSIVLASTGGADPTTTAIASTSFAAAVSAAWFTHLGWQDTVLLAEELHHPRRDLPVVLITTVLVTMALYLAIHAAVYVGLGGSLDAYSDWPAIEVARHVLGNFGVALLSVLLLSSMLGVSAEALMVRTRIPMALARDGLAPPVLGLVNRFGTPWTGLLLYVVVVLVLIASNSFTRLLSLVGFTQGFLGIFETASYFVVRRKRPEHPTSRFHPWAPMLFIVVNVALCVVTALDSPDNVLKAGGLITAISALYFVFRAVEPALARRRERRARRADLPTARARARSPSGPS